MADDIDEALSRAALEYDAKNLDVVIAYYRNRRAAAGTGPKPKKDAGPKQTIDLEALGLKKATPSLTVRKL